MNEAYKEKIAKEFGRFIRESRENKGMIQAEVAKKLSCSRSYYTMIETGDREVSFEMALRICGILDLNIDDFAKRLG